MPWKNVAFAVLVAVTACGHASPTVSAPTPDATGDLRRLEISSHRHIGAFAVDTGSGKVIGYRMDERFPSLSTWKALEAAAILHGSTRLDRTIHWKASQEVDGSPLTKGHGDAGMTVSRLIAAAMSVSDNTAANLLLRETGGPAGLTRYYRSLHDPISRLDHNEPTLNDWRPGSQRDTTTPAAMGRDLYAVTLGKALASPDRDRMIRWLRSCRTGDHRIRAGLPEDWPTGDKTGTGSSYGGVNDVAITWPPSHAPLIIAVYTYGEKGAATDEKVISTAAALLVRGLVPRS